MIASVDYADVGVIDIGGDFVRAVLNRPRGCAVGAKYAGKKRVGSVGKSNISLSGRVRRGRNLELRLKIKCLAGSSRGDGPRRSTDCVGGGGYFDNRAVFEPGAMVDWVVADAASVGNMADAGSVGYETKRSEPRA